LKGSLKLGSTIVLVALALFLYAGAALIDWQKELKKGKSLVAVYGKKEEKKWRRN
jgi:hypothetical protein